MILYSKSVANFRFDVHQTQPDFEFYDLKQTHSAVILNTPVSKGKEGDGLVQETKNWKKPLCIKTADCVPVVAIGEQAVGLIHVGWKGIQNSILLSSELQKLAPTIFFLGPHAKDCCYEVQSEFQNFFPDKNSFIKRNGRLFFSMERQIVSQLLNNYAQPTVLTSAHCTICSAISFHSHRRGRKSGENNWNTLSFIQSH